MPWESAGAIDPWATKLTGPAAAVPQLPASLHLTARESALLRILTTRAGEPISIEVLLSELCPDARVGKNTIEAHVHNLRRKLKLFPDVRIETVPRLGYRLSHRTADEPLADRP